MEELANKVVGIIKGKAPAYDGLMWVPSVERISYGFEIDNDYALAVLDRAIAMMVGSGDYVDMVGGLYHKETMEEYESQLMDFVAYQLAKERGEE